jgi:hypothetical protein
MLHSPVCNVSARSRCIKQGHLTNCRVCGESWSPHYDAEYPYCRNQREKEAARKAKEAEEERKKADKKNKK